MLFISLNDYVPISAYKFNFCKFLQICLFGTQISNFFGVKFLTPQGSGALDVGRSDIVFFSLHFLFWFYMDI